MPRKCSICEHPQRQEIDRLLVNNEPLSRIVSLFPVLTKSALHRHGRKHLPETLSRAREAEVVANSDVIMAELKRCSERVNLLFDACDRWLRDPENQEQYDIGPRAGDIKVIYEIEGSNGKPVRKKAPLSQLLAQVERDYTVHSYEAKHADPRELILKTANSLQGQIELLARLAGELKNEVNLVLQTEEVRALINNLVVVIRGEIQDPEMLERIAKRLQAGVVE